MSDSSAPGRISIAAVAGAAVAATAVRLFHLSGPALWLDEAYSVHLARLGFGRLIEKLVLESTPPLYYVLLGLWMRVFGESPAAMRGLSVVFGLLAVVAVWALVRRHAGEREAVIAAWLLALSPLHVYYSQAARMYAAMTFFGLCLVGSALAFLARRSTRALALFVICGVVMLLLHNVALWFVAGCGLGLTIGANGVRDRVRVAAAAGVLAAAYLPWLLVLARQVGSQSTVLDWFVPYWEARSPLLHLADVFTCFAFGPFPTYLPLDSAIGGSLVASLAVVAAAAFGLSRIRKLPPLRFVVVSFAIALAAAFAYSAFVQPVLIPGRTDVYLLPLFLIVLAAGFAALRPAVAAPIATAAWAALALTVLAPYYRDPLRDTSREIFDALRARAGAGDVVITTGLLYAETEYALRRSNAPQRLDSYPRSASEHPGYLSFAELARDPEALARDAAAIAADAIRDARTGKRVFVLWIERPENAPLLDRLREALTLEEDSGPLFQQSVTATPVQILRFAAPASPGT